MISELESKRHANSATEIAGEGEFVVCILFLQCRCRLPKNLVVKGAQELSKTEVNLASTVYSSR